MKANHSIPIVVMGICLIYLAGPGNGVTLGQALTNTARRSTGGIPDKTETYVNFNFDQVEIRLLVKLVGEMTGRRFVIDKGIEGKISVTTPPQIPVSEAYPLFLSILEANGCAVVEKNGIDHIVRRERRIVPIAPVIVPGGKATGSGLMTKVIHVKHLSAKDVSKIIEPMTSEGKRGGLAVLEATNHLIVTDTAEGIRRIEKIIKEIDKPGMARATDIYRLRFATALDMANELNQAIAGVAGKLETPGQRLRRRLPKPAGTAASLPGDALVVASPHSNSLILVGTPAQIGELKRIITRMDVEPKTGLGHLKAIFLKYLSSDEAAKSLTSLLAKGVDKPQNQKIAIESSIANNALIVNASPQDFEMVKELIAQLDIPPQQVLIEVMFAELTIEEGTEIGVGFIGGGVEEGSSIAIGGLRTAENESDLISSIMSGIAPHGLTFGIAKGFYTDASGRSIPIIPALMNINAIEQNARFKILSNIPLWAQNNQEASVKIVKNIPILKSTVAGGSGTARDYIENIDRIDVGIKLTVTPHINPNREVLMKLNPSIEAIIQETTGGKNFTPTIAKREVTTTMTVADGQTIIISGLIREDTIKRVRKIPILGNIPLIGWLFRNTIEIVERTNLLIFVTPHVITTGEEAMEASKNILAKTAFGSDSGTNSQEK